MVAGDKVTEVFTVIAPRNTSVEQINAIFAEHEERENREKECEKDYGHIKPNWLADFQFNFCPWCGKDMRGEA